MGGDRLPIGVTIGAVGATADWWLESARRLDEAGYHALWAWDHFIAKGTERMTPVLEAWTLLSAAGAVTSRAWVGSFVLNVMNRHPAVVARAAATLQGLAGGRLRLGVGIGGENGEHAAYGIDYPAAAERALRLREAIEVMRALWTGGPVSREGRWYRLEGAVALPRPEPAPPLLVGAQSPSGIRIAAELGDGWAAETPQVERLMPRYLEALDAAGRSRADQTVVLGFAGGRSGQHALRGSPFVVAPREALAEWQARGVDEVTLTARTTEDVDSLVAAAGRW